MKQGKKLFCAALALTAVLCLPGCTQKGNPSSGTVSQGASSQAVSQAESGPYQIGLLQYAESPSPDAVREAFMSRLAEYGYDERKVRIDYQNAKGDASKADAICKGFVESKTDMIVAIDTPAAQAASSAAKGTEVTVLFAADSTGEGLGLKSPETPEGSMTGVSAHIPASAVVDLALKANPQLKTLGLLYTAGEEGPAAMAKEAKAYCESKGLAVVESAVSDAGGLQKAAADLCGKADAIFTPADSGIASSAAVVAEEAKKAKKPWYTGDHSMVRDGALAAIDVEDAELGAKAADMAVELIEGRAVAQVPVFSFKTYQTYINQETLDAVSAKLPEDVLETAYFVAAKDVSSQG